MHAAPPLVSEMMKTRHGHQISKSSFLACQTGLQDEFGKVVILSDNQLLITSLSEQRTFHRHPGL